MSESLKTDTTESVQHWDWIEGVHVYLRVIGSLELNAKLAATIEEILENDVNAAHPNVTTHGGTSLTAEMHNELPPLEEP